MTTCCPRCRGVERVVSNLAELPITLCIACGDRVESDPLDLAPVAPVVAPAIRVPAY